MKCFTYVFLSNLCKCPIRMSFDFERNRSLKIFCFCKLFVWLKTHTQEKCKSKSLYYILLYHLSPQSYFLTPLLYIHLSVCICFIDYAKAFDCVDLNKLENSERDGNTRPPDLPLEKSVCWSESNS